MSTSPQFASTPKVGSAAVSATADNSWTTFTNAVTLFTAGSNGSKVEEIVFQGIGVTLAGVVNLLIDTSGTGALVDQAKFLGVTGSATAPAERFVRAYSSLWVPSGSTLKATSMVANQLVRVTAFYADL